MSPEDKSTDNDEALLQQYAADLADQVERCLRPWVVDQVVRFWPESPPTEVVDAATSAGESAAKEIGAKVRSLLELDIDEHWTTPLALIRTAVSYPTVVLRDAGVPTVDRDAMAERYHPSDVYDITPGGFAALGEPVGDAGLKWGAAKAHVHLKRRAKKDA